MVVDRPTLQKNYQVIITDIIFPKILDRLYSLIGVISGDLLP
jgi:hypothetical protein